MAMCEPAARPRPDRDATHRTAVTTTLGWADAAAAREDFTDALAWLDTIEAIGDQLTPEYKAKRQAWLASTDAYRRSDQNRKAA